MSILTKTTNKGSEVEVIRVGGAGDIGVRINGQAAVTMSYIEDMRSVPMLAKAGMHGPALALLPRKIIALTAEEAETIEAVIPEAQPEPEPTEAEAALSEVLRLEDEAARTRNASYHDPAAIIEAERKATEARKQWERDYPEVAESHRRRRQVEHDHRRKALGIDRGAERIGRMAD